jgi:3-hydroxyisobutyrate dehydrogenase
MTTDVAAKTIGIVGVGTMGSRIAAALLRAGAALVAHDIDPAALMAASGLGAAVVDTLAGLDGAGSVILSLPGPQEVLQVTSGLAALPHGAPHVIDMSTIDPHTARLCARTLSDAGGSYTDAPVLGRPATCGSWTLPVGADAEGFARVQNSLAPVAARIIHVGDTGQGHVVKLLNNLMFGAINAVTAEALSLSRAVGMDPRVFVETVVESGAATVSNLFKDIGPRAVAGRFEPTFTLRLLNKDNLLAVEMAREVGMPLPIGSAITTLNQMAMLAGYGEEDSIAVLKFLDGLRASETSATGRTGPVHTRENTQEGETNVH